LGWVIINNAQQSVNQTAGSLRKIRGLAWQWCSQAPRRWLRKPFGGRCARGNMKIKMSALYFLLGEILHLANQQPPFGLKSDFYQLKDKLLTRWGVFVGHDLQHIVRYCYGCNGEGEIPETRNIFGNPWFITQKCPRCGGSGIYRQFWVNLKRYRLGGREFHIPLQRFYFEKDAGIGYLHFIQGDIEHVSPKFYLAAEACWWLFLFFDRRRFFMHFGHYSYLSMKFTPMVIICSWVFSIRMFFKKAQRLAMDTLFEIMFIKRRFCRHDFGAGEEEYSCSICGAENPKWEVPF
jgi:hypothetical protein